MRCRYSSFGIAHKCSGVTKAISIWLRMNAQLMAGALQGTNHARVKAIFEIKHP